MDRATVQYGQLSLETDLLRAQRYAMIGIGKLFEAIVGTSIAVDGFLTVPTSPASMSVNIGPGQVYQQENLEATPWSSLQADLAHSIVKQGIQLDTATQTFVAPTTVGYAQNFLIQVAYADFDSGLVVRPYYNASNPSVPFNGPGNAGTQDSTVRAGAASLSVKAGVAATSGSQTTPTPDAGYAGLYVVTVAYGQTTITAGNIAPYPGAPFIVKLGSTTSTSGGAGGGLGISGLLPTFGGGTITISAGSCVDSTRAASQRFTSAQNLTGTYTSNTTIHVFVAWGTSAQAVFASTTVNPSSLPSGCTYFRRIFSFRTDGSGNPLSYTAAETAGGAIACLLTPPVLDVSGLSPTSSNQFFALSLPNGILVEWQGNGFYSAQSPGSPFAGRIISPLEPDTSLSGSLVTAIGSSGQPAGFPTPDLYQGTSGGGTGSELTSRQRLTNNAQLGFRGNSTPGNAILSVTTTGWTDFRR